MSSGAPGSAPRPRVVVVGAGICGLSAAIEVSEAGCDATLVERQAHVGGRVAQMHQYFPKLCPPTCGLEINLRRLRTSPRIDVLTRAEVEAVSGPQGALRVKVREQPRFVADHCTACGACAAACPVEVPSGFDAGLRTRRAAHIPYPGAWPPRYAIDPSVCLGASCGKCVAACPSHAIDLSAQPRAHEIETAAIIWATGWDPYDPARLVDLGFGAHPDVVTSVMLERMASPHGPTGGRILRPSNGEPPRSIAFVQCAGSRDDAHLAYCSGVCCMASAKQARYVHAQDPAAKISVYFIDRRAAGRHEKFLAETEGAAGVRFVPGKVARVSVQGGSAAVEAEDTARGELVVEPADLVVLATGMVPSPLGPAVEREVDRDGFGFLTREQSRGGHLVAGCARGPMDVASAVRDATSAALHALRYARRGGSGSPDAAGGR